MTDGDSGEPVANPHYSPGALVDVVGVQAAAAWRSERGLAVLGPRHFGFDVDYLPLAERQSGT